MKIPGSYFSHQHEWDITYTVWKKATAQVSMEFGIPVELQLEVNNTPFPRGGLIYFQAVTRIFFQVFDKEFDSLEELRKFLKLKVFL